MYDRHVNGTNTTNIKLQKKIKRFECKTNQLLILEVTLEGIRDYSFPNYVLKLTLMNS
jgi:hypothetical protein